MMPLQVVVQALWQIIRNSDIVHFLTRDQIQAASFGRSIKDHQDNSVLHSGTTVSGPRLVIIMFFSIHRSNFPARNFFFVD